MAARQIVGFFEGDPDEADALTGDQLAHDRPIHGSDHAGHRITTHRGVVRQQDDGPPIGGDLHGTEHHG